MSNAASIAAQQAAQLAARLRQENKNQNNSNNAGGAGGVVPPSEAVQRARELISKMVGQAGNNQGGNGGGGFQGQRPGLGSNNFHNNANATTFDIMIPGHKVGLVIGKGGESIKQLQERCGVKMVVVQEGPGNDGQDKPLRMSGDFDKVENAKQIVFEYLQELDQRDGRDGGGRDGGGRGGPRGGDRNDRGNGRGGPRDRDNHNRNDWNGGNGGGGGNNRNNFHNNRNNDPYEGNDGMHGMDRGMDRGGMDRGGYGHHMDRGGMDRNHGNMDRGGGGGGRNSNHEVLEVVVPKVAVGVVIGKGGDMIKRIAKESGCKLQFVEGSEPNGDRKCVLQGIPACVEAGKRMIDELVDGSLKRHGLKPDDNGYQGPMVTREEYTFTVPASKCGIIIGRGGDTIKQINQQSGAHCEMDRKTSANQTNEKTFNIKGEQHQIDEARRLITEKINIELNMIHVGSQQVPATQTQQNQNPYAAWTGFGQSWDQSQQSVPINPQTGQPDYSQQWIEYYKSMGMTREAEMIEQQIKTRAQGGGAPAQSGGATNGQAAAQAASAAAAPTAAAGGQQDYSAQWAEYYRRIGKIEEAEAIEKQIAAAKVSCRYPVFALINDKM